MKISVNASSLRQTKWYEYAVRFLFGGCMTVITGIIAEKWGPEVGGLFLAFPAIFPASVTLIEKHEKQRKQEEGMAGAQRAREAAAADAAGAAMGSFGLVVFGLVVWRLMPNHSAGLVLTLAVAAWALTAVSVWTVRKRI